MLRSIGLDAHLLCIGGEWRSVEIVRTYQPVYEEKFFFLFAPKVYLCERKKNLLSAPFFGLQNAKPSIFIA